MRYHPSTPHERGRLRAEASWRSILLLPVVVLSLIAMAFVVSEYPILLTGVVVGVLLPRLAQVARRIVLQLTAVLRRALNESVPESSARQHTVTE